MSRRFARPATGGRPLSDASLRRLARPVVVPRYRRRALTPSVVHLGVGSFHRSHQAVYFDDLAQQGISRAWGLTGVGLRSRAMHDALTAQDCLYTVLERGADGDRARVIGVIGRYLFGPDRPCAVLDALADPRTRVVTLTVTGRAYALDPDELRADLASPGAPRSAIGYLVAALDRRRRAGTGPFTVLSCDNLPDNGRMTRRAVLAFAGLRDDRLAAWIDEHVAFPSSMVDRITPRTTTADRLLLGRRFGVEDRWPVVTEPFSQWVIEDDFSAGRPPLDAVGARFVADARPHALLKTRLLNGTHCALGALGTVAGLRRMDEAMSDPALAAYAMQLMDGEVAPLLGRVPGVSLPRYTAALRVRFANPTLADQLGRLCRSGSTKLPEHVVPSLREALDAERPHTLLVLALAGWMRHLRGVDERGRPLAVEDPRAARLTALALAGGSDPRPLLSVGEVFGDLGDRPGVVAELRHALEALDRDGVRGTLDAALAGGQPVPA